MLAVLLKILSIIGIVLLVLLGILLLVLLLVLFFPITYRAEGEKNPERLYFCGRMRWLFGFLRVNARYEDGFAAKVKLLMFTLYDSEKTARTDEEQAQKESTSKESKSKESPQRELTEKENSEKEETAGKPTEAASAISKQSEISQTEAGQEDILAENAAEEKSYLTRKIEKIKFTFREKYDKIKSIFEKIKIALENLEYYKSVLEEKETRLLLRHVGFRLKKLWKALKPKKYRADILFGTGSPDTTGYAFGIYGMLSPQLGQNICVTPDFTRAVLEGNFFAFGRITVFTILVQTVSVLLDKRLRLFIDKIKRGTSDK